VTNDPAGQLQQAFELHQAGRFDEAMVLYRQVAELPIAGTSDAQVMACLNLATLCEQRGDPAGATGWCARVRNLQPDLARGMLNRAVALQAEGELNGARELYDRALRIDPDYALAYFNRATLHKRLMHFDEAISDYQAALRLKPDNPDAYNNLAVIFHETGQLDAAVGACRAGLAIAPESASLWANLAIAQHMLGLGDEALAAYRRVVELRPDSAADHSNLLYAMNFLPGFDDARLFAEHKSWAARHAEPLSAAAMPARTSEEPERRLRVGYLSPYFRMHAVNYFFEPLLAAHDHQRFEIYCYADQVQHDSVTVRLRARADCWRDVKALADEPLANLIRADQIDVLVDLSGHIGGNRLRVFARRVAPVQVTYLGYQNTTGLSAMNYRLTDAWADPPGATDRFYTEQLYRLPEAFFCYQPLADSPPLTALSAESNGYVTFGSFNNFAKVTPQVIATWLEILRRTPNARLSVLAQRGGSLEARLRAEAARHGIEPNRIELHDKRPTGDYLRLIQQADISLDPFPFNGHTTTCDAIWMGVPVVMLAGRNYVSRFGGSVLRNVGLNSLIAETRQQYVDIAVQLASDVPALARLRSELRSRMAQSRLLDFQGFTRDVEQAYREMWRAWCASQPKG